MAKQTAVSVREALGGRQRSRRPRASEDPQAAQAAREDFRALGWAVEYTQRQQSLLWLGQGVDGVVGGLTGAAPHPWDTDFWSEW